METQHPEDRSKPIGERSTLIVTTPEEQNLKIVERYSLDSSSKTNDERTTFIVNAPSEYPDRPDLSINTKLSQYFSSLSCEQLWQELFNRLLKGKIGRLYFKCDRNNTSIICSDNGITQFSLDNLSRSTYKYLIQKLKSLTNLPYTPLTKTKKFEMLRWYKQERILLCLQLSPSEFGCEGTLQILRGKALEFYQQKQMEELGREALQLSRQLERKLRQIQLRSRINPEPLENLNELTQLQQQILQNLTSIAKKQNS